MDAGSDAVIEVGGLDALIAVLRSDGLRTVGPVVRDGAVVHGELSGTADLPTGRHDVQAPGRYRTASDGGGELFGWAVGPTSPKSSFFTPSETVWRATVAGGTVTVTEPDEDPDPLALVGVRPCEVAALGVLDRVLAEGRVPDDRYTARRRATFVLVVECGAPAATCFCPSMGTGPAAAGRHDLALTELLEGGHRFYVRVGSAAGAAVLAGVAHRPATDDDRTARAQVLDRAERAMTRTLPADVAGLLARNLDHPRWDEVADRCLSCGNCTLVCPTCFCSDVHDVTDLAGDVERQRRWASCFDLEHSFLHGGAVRPTTASRYRQWMTHKLSTWWDQFGRSGCVGCGRCITWCPVGIDLTEEAEAIRASDGLVAAGRADP